MVRKAREAPVRYIVLVAVVYSRYELLHKQQHCSDLTSSTWCQLTHSEQAEKQSEKCCDMELSGHGPVQQAEAMPYDIAGLCCEAESSSGGFAHSLRLTLMKKRASSSERNKPVCCATCHLLAT